jgi:hypothetical protein
MSMKIDVVNIYIHIANKKYWILNQIWKWKWIYSYPNKISLACFINYIPMPIIQSRILTKWLNVFFLWLTLKLLCITLINIQLTHYYNMSLSFRYSYPFRIGKTSDPHPYLRTIHIHFENMIMDENDTIRSGSNRFPPLIMYGYRWVCASSFQLTTCRTKVCRHVALRFRVIYDVLTIFQHKCLSFD